MLKYFSKSQLFLALCAALLSAESYLISGLDFDYVILVTVFFATLFIYNASRLKIVVKEGSRDEKPSLTLSGDKPHILLCAVSITIVFACLAASHFYNIFIFMLTAILSVFYMMPFVKNGKPIIGLRNHLVLKNVVLSIVWASATVLFPLAGEVVLPEGSSLVFMFLRRFFFIYALTVVYDIRDIESDKLAGMKTLAVRFGDLGARVIGLMILIAFVFFIAVDPTFNAPGPNSLSLALYLSAICTAIVIAGTRKNRGYQYYSFVVDGAMALQFILVLLFASVLP